MSSNLMQYRNLGKSGLRVSKLGLGTWVTFGGQIADEMAEEILNMAYKNGINFFDTAEVYCGGKAEITLGKILKKKGWRRSSYIISTKLFWGGPAETEKGLSRKHVIEGLQGSLNRLQLDYVDIAWANKSDFFTPMEEIVRGFTQAINMGLAFYWGTSRWSTTEIMEAYSIARQFNLIPPIAEQTEYNLFQREKVELQMPALYKKLGTGTMTWSPLGCGMLTGKYEDGIPLYSRAALKGYGWLKDKILSDEGKQEHVKLKELSTLALSNGLNLTQLCIGWCLSQDNFVQCILMGVSSLDQLSENLQTIHLMHKFTPQLLNQIDSILQNRPNDFKNHVLLNKSA